MRWLRNTIADEYAQEVADEDKIYEKWKQKNSEIKLEYQKKYDEAKTDAQKNNILDEFKKKLNS